MDKSSKRTSTTREEADSERGTDPAVVVDSTKKSTKSTTTTTPLFNYTKALGGGKPPAQEITMTQEDAEAVGSPLLNYSNKEDENKHPKNMKAKIIINIKKLALHEVFSE